MMVDRETCRCDRCGHIAQMDIDDQGEHIGGTVRVYPDGWEGIDEVVLCPDCSPELLKVKIEQLQREVSDWSDCSHADDEWGDGLRELLESPPDDPRMFYQLAEDARDEIMSLKECVYRLRKQRDKWQEFVAEHGMQEKIAVLQGKPAPEQIREALSEIYVYQGEYGVTPGLLAVTAWLEAIVKEG